MSATVKHYSYLKQTGEEGGFDAITLTEQHFSVCRNTVLLCLPLPLRLLGDLAPRKCLQGYVEESECTASVCGRGKVCVCVLVTEEESA